MLTLDSKMYTWKELVREFPNKWVVVENAELTNAGFIKSGKLIGVCEDTEIDEFVVSCYKDNRNINYERTTEGSGVGIMATLFEKYVTEEVSEATAAATAAEQRKGIRGTARAYFKCKYSPKDTREAVMEEYPNVDESIITAIIDEIYGLVK